MQGAITSIVIRSAQNGNVLYQHNANLRLRPASNMKLLTTAAALYTLGPEHTFQTQLLTDGKVNRKGIRGNLYLKGMGDPTLTKVELDHMVKKLKQRGIHYIHGDLVADDTWFDDVRYSIDLPWSDEEMYYGAQISALTLSPKDNVDPGTIMIEIEAPNDKEEDATIKIKPKNKYIHLINHIQVVDENDESDLSIKREHGTNNVVIEGNLPIKSEKISKIIAVWEPTGLVIDQFQQSLKEQGIKHQGNIKVAKSPENAKLLSTNHSKPLSDIIIPFMKLSLNTYGEMLVKEMGKQVKGTGSWECGLDVLNHALGQIGLNIDTFVIRDGSGISHVNAITTYEISNLLYLIQKESWFSDYFHSLPVAGIDRLQGGTLQDRLNDSSAQGKVYAKTGTISTVSSISGFVETRSGETLIFSMILNHLLDHNKGKEIEDEIMVILADM